MYESHPFVIFYFYHFKEHVMKGIPLEFCLTVNISSLLSVLILKIKLI